VVPSPCGPHVHHGHSNAVVNNVGHGSFRGFLHFLRHRQRHDDRHHQKKVVVGEDADAGTGGSMVHRDDDPPGGGGDDAVVVVDDDTSGNDGDPVVPTAKRMPRPWERRRLRWHWQSQAKTSFDSPLLDGDGGHCLAISHSGVSGNSMGDDGSCCILPSHRKHGCRMRSKKREKNHHDSGDVVVVGDDSVRESATTGEETTATTAAAVVEPPCLCWSCWQRY